MKNKIFLCAVLFLANISQAQTPLTNTFTYQGELKFNNALANGSYDFEFSVFDVDIGGSALEIVVANGVTVTNGVFSTPITLSNDLFTGNKIWLDIAVRANGTANPFDLLSPRQEVSSSPYAIHAQFVGADAVTGVQIQDGTISNSDIDINSIQQRVTGACPTNRYMKSIGSNGSVVCGVDQNTISAPSWELGGNAANAGDFIGTTNTTPFNVSVNSNRILSLQDNTDGSNHVPNIIMGALDNSMSGTYYGSTISGGRLNSISDIYSVISGGSINNASAPGSSIGGGLGNTASGGLSTIPGGNNNQAGGEYSFAAGRKAKVRDSNTTGTTLGDQGTFVWADSTNANYTSSGSNQFLVRASGGVVLTDDSADNNPFSAQLFIDSSRDPIQARLSGFTKFRVHSNGGVSIGDNGTPPTNGLRVSGNITKGGGSFKIDHPLDPENKYLSHSFVESPDMMNVYNGNITTDKLGNAWVELPDWFEALNRDFRYQLTVIGSFSRVMIAQKVKGNQFLIKTEDPRVEVSWQITGIRHDKFANKNRIPVEEVKDETEVGTYLHPSAWEVSDKSKWLSAKLEMEQENEK